MIRNLKPKDFPAVRQIYRYGLSTGNATFETELPTWEGWDRSHLFHSRFVHEHSLAGITGWAALSPVSDREAYRGVAEVSVYLGAEFLGQGIGTRLLTALVDSSEKHGVWSLYSSLFPENAASIALHEKCGFREVGFREKIGCLDGIWRNTVIMERRSGIVGI